MNYILLSKEMSCALRHEPQAYGLELDEFGAVDVNTFVEALRKKEKWKEVTIEDVRHVILHAEKKRHVIEDGKIRALYGHSIDGKVVKEKVPPPIYLYHGTSRDAARLIVTDGLKSMLRQYVHLGDIDNAWRVGLRKDPKPVIFRVDGLRAFRDGIGFYHGNDKIWLSDNIPAVYISVECNLNAMENGNDTL